LAPARIIQVGAREWGTPILEHPLQAALTDVGLGHVLRDIGQAEPGQRSIEHLIGVVEDQLTVNVDIQLALTFFEFPRIQAAARGQAQIDAIMFDRLLRIPCTR
jgi:hypothetical protein